MEGQKKMIKVIDLDLLNHIIEKYQIPRDIRAREAIEDMAYELPPAEDWHKPSDLVPTHTDSVLVVIDGCLGAIRQHNAYHLACYFKDGGWLLNDRDCEHMDFTVKRWRELPDLPEELAEQNRRLLHE